MSKAMRVVDREIIERQVVNAWRDKSLSEIKELVESTGFGDKLTDLISDYNGLVDQIKELEKQRDTLKDDMNAMTKEFNDSHCAVDESHYRYNYQGSYVQLELAHYGNSKCSDWKYETNIPNDIRTGISDELGLQTMGGDFNGKDLVRALIEKFVG
tara:strand:- start:918 stop:1385 length:468 start_codon:yes stop_codon:yes gene_type:complete